MISKKEAREIVFKKRENEATCFFDNLNKIFYKNFLSIDFLTNIGNEVIAGYYAFYKECNIFEILKYYLKNNQIALPSIIKKNESMVFKEWNCSINNLEKNNLFKKAEILEPSCNSKILQPNIVFVPAVAVDVYGNRVGYGGGYYDRSLSNLNCLKIAVVYDFQVFNEEVENNHNDIKMDYILTEKNFIKIFNNKYQ